MAGGRVRRHGSFILDSLVDAEDSGAVPILTADLNHTDTEIRRAAAHLLGRLGAAETVPAIVEQLGREKHGGVRMELVGALGGIGKGSELAVPALLEIVESHPSDTLKREALFALAAFLDAPNLKAELERIATTARPEIAAEIREFLEDFAPELGRTRSE